MNESKLAIVPNQTVTHESRNRVYTLTVGNTYNPKPHKEGRETGNIRYKKVTILGIDAATEFRPMLVSLQNEDGKRTTSMITSFLTTYQVSYIEKEPPPPLPKGTRTLVVESEELLCLKGQVSALQDQTIALTQRVHALESCLRTLGWKGE